MQKRVVITGGGAVSALGQSWSEIRSKLIARQNCVRYMHEWDVYPEMSTRLASPVDGFSLPAHYTTKRKRSMGRVAQLGVRATELALEDAGLLNADIIKSGETGVAYGSATGSSDAGREFFHMLEGHSMSRINSTTYLRMMSHSAAVNISVYFGTEGRMYTTSSACTAGSQAIGYAYENILAGKQKIMLAGGSEELCPTQAAVFDTVYATSTCNQSPETSPRPFEKNRDGLVIGEGACTVVLEDLEHARSRGATILAEIVGYATNTDGAHLVKPQTRTMAKVMREALTSANLDASQIGYISAHGTATEHGDVAECVATAEVMGSETPASSLKSYIGHSLGACGSLETWLSIQMMNENWFAPTLNLDEIDERCSQMKHIQNNVYEAEVNFIMNNNFAFGGINTSLIFKRWLDS